MFKLEATFGDISRTAEVTVIVHPLTGEDNATGGNDDNATGGGSDDNGSTGGTDDNVTGGGEDNTTIPDTTPPILTLNGENNITLTVGETYTELGATAMDERDGRLSVAIIGDVNSSQIGTYTLTYTATDRAGNRSSATRTVTILPATLTGLTLTVNATSLNKDANTTLKVEATYSDNTTKDVTDTVAWLINHPDAIQIQNHTLTAKQDINTTLRAKIGDKTSNAVTLDLYWEVNGHRLPPEPDPAVNNATLLGVDINDNGVRDDVERWIYNKYKDKHPIHIDIAMQAARGYKLVLETPEKAKEIHDEVRKPLHCEVYFGSCIKDPLITKPIVVDLNFDNILFNTKKRKKAYLQYDTLLSGDSYTIPWCSDMKKECDFNTSKYEEK